MTDSHCHSWLQKKTMTRQQGNFGSFSTDFYVPVWVMEFRVFYHQTTIFTGENGVD